MSTHNKCFLKRYPGENVSRILVGLFRGPGGIANPSRDYPRKSLHPGIQVVADREKKTLTRDFSVRNLIRNPGCGKRRKKS